MSTEKATYALLSNYLDKKRKGKIRRSVTGFMVNLLAGFVAYTYQPKKPSLGLKRNPLLPVIVM
jgi:hypothetical protein